VRWEPLNPDWTSFCSFELSPWSIFSPIRTPSQLRSALCRGGCPLLLRCDGYHSTAPPMAAWRSSGDFLLPPFFGCSREPLCLPHYHRDFPPLVQKCVAPLPYLLPIFLIGEALSFLFSLRLSSHLGGAPPQPLRPHAREVFACFRFLL